MNRITKILNALIDILRLHPKHSFVIFHSSSCIGEYMLPCHGAVVEAIPQLGAMNTQYGDEWIGTMAVARYRVDRLYGARAF